MQNLKQPKNNVLYLLHYAWIRNKKFYLYLCINTMLLAVLPFISIFLSKAVIGELIGEGRIPVLSSILVIALITWGFVYMGAAYLKSIYYPTLNRLRHELLNAMEEKCMHVSYAYLENPKILDNNFRVWQAVNGTEHGVEGVYRKLFLAASGGLSLIGYISLLGFLSPAILLYILINMVIMYLVLSKARTYEFMKEQEKAAPGRKEWYLNGIMSDFELGKEIRVYNLADWLGNLFKTVKAEILTLEKQILTKNLSANTMDILLMLLRDGVIYFYLIYKVLQGTLGIDDFMMYFLTIANFSMTLSLLNENITDIRMQDMILNEYRKFMNYPDENKGGDVSLLPDAETFSLTFEDVSFKYPGTDNYIFEHLSFTVSPGEKLAIVGMNGAGKTTLVKLIARLYEPNNGTIYINGIAISKLPLHPYRKLLSVVFQEVKIFAFPIAENIGMKALGKLDVEGIQEAVNKAGLDEKISSLPKGIYTALQKHLDKDGIQLSGGENQKLALARALYKQGKIMILDEPTAALDAIAEHQVYEDFNTLASNRTTLYISHRLASTQFCDRILLFEHGKIIEEGTHETLMKQEGTYTSMYHTQAKYYQYEEEVIA